MPPIKMRNPYTKRLLCTTLFAACLLLLLMLPKHESASSASDPSASSAGLIRITPGVPIDQEISAGATEVFEISVEEGKLLRLSIEKGDLVLSISLYGPTGAKLWEQVSEDLEPVEISFPIETSGSYKLELRSREILQTRRTFELRIEPFGPITDTEQKESEARRVVAGAEVLRANWKAADLRQAREKFEQAAKIWLSINDFSDASLATLKTGDISFRLSEFSEAVAQYKDAETFAQKTENRLAQGKALSRIGLVYSYQGDNDRAQNYVDRALDLLKFAETDSSPLARSAYGEALANAAEVTYSKGNLAKSCEQFKEAIKYLDQDRKAQAKIDRFIGSIAGSLGDADQAVSDVRRAQELSQAINDRAGEGLALTLLGLFYSFNKNQHPAIDLQNKALEIFRSIGDRHSEAIALNALGTAYQKLNPEYALMNVENALRLFESTGAFDLVAVTTFKLAEIHKDLGNNELALGYLNRCLALSRAAKKVRNEANALSEIAMVYASQKRPGEATKQNRKLQEFYESIGDRRGQATALNNYGDFLLKSGQKEQALEVYKQALTLSERVGDKGILTTTLYNLACANQALAKYGAALEFIERSILIIEELRAGVGTPDMRVLYFSGVRKHYDLCRDILMQLDDAKPSAGFAARAFLVSERSRARSLVDLVRESQAHLRESAEGELLRREREVAGLIRALAEYEMELSPGERKQSTESDDVSRRLAQLKAEYQEIQVKLRAQNPGQLPLADFEVKDLAQIQQALKDGEMLLEYSLGQEQSYLWAITSNSLHSYKLEARHNIEDAVTEVNKQLMARQTLDGRSADYQSNIETSDNLYVMKARDLSQMLLGPVADQLQNRRIIFVTEGALQLVQFEALPVPHSKSVGPTGSEKRLIETNEIVAIPSMTTLLAIRTVKKRVASPARVVAILADPVLTKNDERVRDQERSTGVAHAADALTSDRRSADNGLRDGPARLVYASEEADTIAALAPRGTTMVAKGFDASRETAMSSRIGEYQIVHFATHGFLDSEHPELSGILLTSVDQNGVERNGLMALHDIYTLDLSAELTVLSACQTALGKDIKGEGVVGLSHSFISAGSKSVVASMWKVQDHATTSLMSEFYELMLRKRMPPVAALRAAKLKMMHEERWKAPYYWAGFVFQGDYESRIKIENSSRLYVGLALLFAVLIFSGLIVFWRRRRWLSPTKGIERVSRPISS